MRLGYSFWGFLFHGIKDTPDGGRIHRLPFLRSLIDNGAEIVCMQKNRDLEEGGFFSEIEGLTFDSEGMPSLDALLCEYRWPICGRNTYDDRGSASYTPDLDRQNELIDYYGGRIPIIIWDKDLKLSCDNIGPYVVADAALAPREGHFRLLFSFDKKIRDDSLASLENYSHVGRKNDLVYIGNQYERDVSFKKYLNESGKLMGNCPLIYGNWTKYPKRLEENLINYPDVSFCGRLAFKDLRIVYRKAFSTVLIAPDRYYRQGQITQRIFESLESHVIPFVPCEYRHVEDVVLDDLRVSCAKDVVDKIRLFRAKGDMYIQNLLRAQIYKLNCYSSSLQSQKVLKILNA